MKKIGIIVPDNLGIGDKIQFAHVPENFYKNYGHKLIDVCNCWVFDHNPYIERNINSEYIINLWSLSWDKGDYLSRAEMMNSKLGFSKIYCRSPKLYFNEDPNNIDPNKICIHSQGISSNQTLSEKIILKIKERYSKYNIVQIGGKNDFDCNVNDARGLNMWESVKQISSSAIFIGINSGMMNIANCYPHINKKLIIDLACGQFDEKLNNFYPLSFNHHLFGWIDYGWQYYNDTEVDIGCTYSYNKI